MQKILSNYPDYCPPQSLHTGTVERLRVQGLFAAMNSLHIESQLLIIEPGVCIAAPNTTIYAQKLFLGQGLRDCSLTSCLYGEKLQIFATHMVIGQNIQISSGTQGAINCAKATFLTGESTRLSPSQKLIEKLLNHDAELERVSSIQEAPTGDTTCN